MRFVLIFTLVTLAGVPSAFAATSDKILDSQQLASLAAKADQATPRERCYRYAELVNSMTMLASQQLNAGDLANASTSLKEIQQYTDKIHLDMADNAKKLKDAQIIMRRTAFRLRELMLDASLSDRPTIEATVQQLDRVQSQMMVAVLRK